jgi:hypothetical protein
MGRWGRLPQIATCSMRAVHSAAPASDAPASAAPCRTPVHFHLSRLQPLDGHLTHKTRRMRRMVYDGVVA